MKRFLLFHFLLLPLFWAFPAETFSRFQEEREKESPRRTILRNSPLPFFAEGAEGLAEEMSEEEEETQQEEELYSPFLSPSSFCGPCPVSYRRQRRREALSPAARSGAPVLLRAPPRRS